jgi:hypothetical protein
VRAFADGAEAVERGNAEGRGEIAVGAASGRSFAEGETHFAGEPLPEAEQLNDAGGALERRAIDAAGDFDARTFEDGFERVELAIDQGRIGGAGDANIHAREGAIRNHIRVFSRFDDGGLHGDAAARMIEAHQALDLQGELVDGVDAFLGIDAGVSRAAGNEQLGVADTFALRFHAAFGTERGLEDQDGIAAERLALDDAAGRATADFFVRGPKEDEALARDNSRATKGVGGEESDDQAALHIESAGAPGTAAQDAERHAREGTAVVHRVEMAENEELSIGASAAEAKFSANVAAAMALAENLDVRAAPVPFGGDEAAHCVHGGFVVAGRFRANHATEESDHCGFIAAERTEESDHCGFIAAERTKEIARRERGWRHGDGYASSGAAWAKDERRNVEPPMNTDHVGMRKQSCRGRGPDRASRDARRPPSAGKAQGGPRGSGFAFRRFP